MKNKNKVIFVLVEGPSDRTALAKILENVYRDAAVHIWVEYGDITTRLNPMSTSTTILNQLGSRLTEFVKRARIRFSDVVKYIHIVDMDGAYIEETEILFDQNASKTIYTEINILTDKVDSIKKRNRQKKECINKLVKTRTIRKIPYQVYYMSSNLDHVLYNLTNLNPIEKTKLAMQFSNRYSNNVDKFLEFINHREIKVSDKYEESWAFIREGRHSLERHSNLNICFTDFSRDL